MKRAIIIIALILTGCGEQASYGRIAQDGETVHYGDSNTALCAPGINRGRPNYETSDILPEVRYFSDKDAEGSKVIIMIGTNDILHGTDDNFAYNINRIFAELKGRDVTVLNIPPTAYWWINERVQMRNAELKALADIFGYTYVDKYSELGPEHFLSDGIHLNADGCNVIYNTGG